MTPAKRTIIKVACCSYSQRDSFAMDNQTDISPDLIRALEDCNIGQARFQLLRSLRRGTSDNFQRFDRELSHVTLRNDQVIDSDLQEIFAPEDKWNEDYLLRQEFRLMRNFSRRRIEHIKSILGSLYMSGPVSRRRRLIIWISVCLFLSILGTGLLYMSGEREPGILLITCLLPPLVALCFFKRDSSS